MEMIPEQAMSQNVPVAPEAPRTVEEQELNVDEEKLVSHVLETFEDAQKARSPLEEKWHQYYNQKHGILKKKTRPWPNCSNINVPLTQIVLDTYQANLMESLFSTVNVLDVKPVSVDDTQTAEKRKQFLNWSLDAETKIQVVSDQIIDSGNTYGDVFPKIRYVIDEQFDSVKVDVPNIDDIFKAPHSTFGVQKQNCEYLIHRVRVSKAEYQAKVDSGEYAEIDFESYKNENPNQASFRSIESMRNEDMGLSEELVDDGHYITLLEWYGTYYNEKSKSWEEIIAVVHPESKTLCKSFINSDGFRPFVQMSPRPELNSCYGVSIPETLKYLQAELNTIHNQRIDAATKRIMQPGFYRPGSGFTPKQFFLEPNGMYPLDEPGADVYFPQFQDAPASQFNEEQAIWKYMEQLMGVSENVQGAFSSGEKSATEVASVDQRSSIRFNLVYGRYKQSFKDMFDMIAALHQKYMPEAKEYRIVGHNGKFQWDSLKKSEMAGKMDLVLTCNSVINENTKRQVAQMIYAAGSQNPQVMSNQRAYYELSKYYFSTLAGNQGINIDLILPKPPQAQCRTPEEEHELMYNGKIAMPDLREDAQYHLITHDGELNQYEFHTQVPPEIQALFIDHLERTKQLVQAQMAVQQQGAFPQVGTAPVQPGSTQPAPAPGGGGMKQSKGGK